MAMDKDDWGSSFGCASDWYIEDIKKLKEQLRAAKIALEFYAKPESIEPYLIEGEEKIFGRPGIKMAFYDPAREALKVLT